MTQGIWKEVVTLTPAPVIKILKQSCPSIKLNPLPKVKTSWQGRWRSSSLSPSKWVTPQQQRLEMKEHTSHPWKSATYFQCLSSPKTQIQGCLCQLNTQTVQFWGLQRSLQNLIHTRGKQEPPKAQRSRLPVQGHREGAQLQRQQHSDALRVSLGCWEPRSTLLLYWWDSSECCDSLWEPKWLNEDQAKGIQSSQLRITDLGVGERWYHPSSCYSWWVVSVCYCWQLPGGTWMLVCSEPALKEYEDGQKLSG